jgi:lipoprotein LprG
MVGIGARYWETNLLTGEWEELPEGLGFNPAILFDPQVGFQSILASDLDSLSLEGNEELEEMPGKILYKLSGELKGERIYTLSYGLIGPEPAQVSMWISPETFEVYRVLLVENKPAASEPTQWQVDFWDFDKPVVISPPT